LQQERLWGLLIAHQCRHARQWQQSEINLFNQLAGQAAIAIQQSELYHQLQQANQELQRLACLDGLTQVGNRRCFDDTFNAQWQRLAREQGSLSLILYDDEIKTQLSIKNTFTKYGNYPRPSPLQTHPTQNSSVMSALIQVDELVFQL
jgi:hypothetical protein